MAAELVSTFDRLLGKLPPSEHLATLLTVALAEGPEITPDAAQKLAQRVRARRPENAPVSIGGRTATLLDLFMQSQLRK